MKAEDEAPRDEIPHSAVVLVRERAVEKGWSNHRFSCCSSVIPESRGDSWLSQPLIQFPTLQLIPQPPLGTPVLIPRPPGLDLPGPLEVTLFIAPIEQLESVCTGGEEYRLLREPVENEIGYEIAPYTIWSTPLSDESLRTITVGTFSLCVEVVSASAGTVTIDKLTFSLRR